MEDHYKGAEGLADSYFAVGYQRTDRPQALVTSVDINLAGDRGLDRHYQPDIVGRNAWTNYLGRLR